MAFGIASIAGILAGAIPKGFEYFERRQDNKQEIAILEKQYAAQKDIENTRFDMSRIEHAEESYQASLQHDTNSASHKPNTWFGGVLMDLINAWRSSMRPGIVSTFMGLYVLFKISTIYALTGGDMQAPALATAILAAWTVNDWAMLELGVSYYITNRGVEKLSGRK
jgi:hypothetical protein